MIVKVQTVVFRKMWIFTLGVDVAEVFGWIDAYVACLRSVWTEVHEEPTRGVPETTRLGSR